MTPGERTQIRKAVRAVKAQGFHPVAVDDGGDDLIRGVNVIMKESEVLDAVGAVDDAYVLFRTDDNIKKPRRAWFRVVLGNAKDGSEVIADNTVTPGFAEALDAIMMD